MVKGLGGRLFLAHNALERKLGRKVPYAELGRLIAQREGRVGAKGKLAPYSGGNVLRWEQEKKRPSLEALEAFAELTGLRKGWLAFEEGAMEMAMEAAPLPTNTKLTPLAAPTPVTKKSAGRAGATSKPARRA